MKKNILMIAFLLPLAVFGMTEDTKAIYEDLKTIYFMEMDSSIINFIQESECSIKEDDLFLVKDLLLDTFLNKQDFNTDFGLYFIIQKPASHPYYEHFLLIVEGKKKLYNLKSKDWLLRDLYRYKDAGIISISDTTLINVVRYLIYPLGNENLLNRCPKRIINVGQIEYVVE